MQAIINKKFNNNFLLLAVLVTASILRFWNYSEIPFMHDELSGLFRAQSQSIADVIFKTKETDVHPIGIPLFIHFWSILFGNSEVAIKFPFIICGLLSIFFTYKIASSWFNDTVALVTCSFMATLQYTTMYGQLARPYASGICFSVMLVWFWSEFFFKKKEKNFFSLMGFIISGTLCAYNHYFSLLFAAIVGITGLFLLKKETIIPYLLSCITILILFLPMLSVFAHHLSMGGAKEEDWIAKPENDWIYVFLKYIFHYSKLVYALVIIILVLSFFHLNNAKFILNKKRIITAIFACSSFLVAFFYSIYKNPVLQFSTLTFSLPFILMLLFSFLKEMSLLWKTVLFVLISSINIYSLTTERKHYALFYKQNYDAFACFGFEAINNYGEQNVNIALVSPDGFMDYYFKKYNKRFSFYSCNNNLCDFRKFVESRNGNYFIAGNLPLEFLQVLNEIFPYKIKEESGFTLNLYCFSKEKFSNSIDNHPLFVSKNSFEQKLPNWNNELLSLSPHFFRMDSTIEYSPMFSAKLIDITKGKHNIINGIAEIKCMDSLCAPILVMDIVDSKGLKIWRGGSRSVEGKNQVTEKIYISQLLSEINLEKHPDAEIKIYVWNKNKKEVIIKQINIEVIESNPYIYGLYYPF